MALVVPDVGEQELLKNCINNASPDNRIIHLYTNDKVPAEGDLHTGYTAATASGYGPITLSGTNWVVNTSAGVTLGEYPQVTFTFTAGEPTIYGYYVTNNAVSILLWAERFTDGPYVIPGGGGTLKITPRIALD